MSRPDHLTVRATLVLLFAVAVAGCKSHPRHEARRRNQQGARAQHASPAVHGTITWESTPVRGALVTVVGREGATVTTGPDGRFALLLPASSTQLIRVTRDGARTVQSALVVGADGFDLESIPGAEFGRVYSDLGLTEDPARGG